MLAPSSNGGVAVLARLVLIPMLGLRLIDAAVTS